MAGSTPLQLYSYPTTGDAASPAGIQTLAQAIEKQVVAVFADTATRDSRWTAATGLANGAMCFIIATGELQLRSGGAWVVIGGRAAPFSTHAGTGTIGLVSGAANNSNTVGFTAGWFSVTPIITLQPQGTNAGSQTYTPRTSGMSTSGFTVFAYATVPSTFSATVTVNIDWHAMQMTSSTAAG